MGVKNNRLEGRVAIVTGGGRGIGKGVTARFVAEGAIVVIANRTAATGEATARELASQGGHVLALAVDVSDRVQVEEMVSRTVAEFGKLDILVNNAAVSRSKHWLGVDEDDWNFIFRVNALGYLYCMQAAARRMIEQRAGRIINMSSIAAKVGSPYSVPYNAAKAAINSLTRTAALDLAPYGINVNAICPGWVETDMTVEVSREWEQLGGITSEERRRRDMAQIPLHRGTTPEEVAGLVAFLASDDAAYMTGQAINFTGGSIMD